MKKYLSAIAAISLLSGAFISPSVFALSTDRDQPAEISSDEVDVDFNTGRRTFIGNVRFIQGTLRVKADRIDAVYKEGQIAEATAYGKPAAFRQRPDGKDADVEGRGQTIVMNQLENTLTLKKNASLKQGFDVAKGSVIFYNMADDTLKVKGNARGETGEQKAAAKPRTETDDFFNEPIKPLAPEPAAKPAPAPEKQSSSAEPDSTNSVQTDKSTDEKTEESSKAPVQERNLIPEVNNNPSPDEIVLPGQIDNSDSEEESGGRSRLIIKPKS